MPNALSPLDGRYVNETDPLRETMTEEALMKARVRVEIDWLLALSKEKGIAEVPEFSVEQEGSLLALKTEFGPADVTSIKAHERRTRHDVKAVEYHIRERLAQIPGLEEVLEFVHFALTSEDVNNLAYGTVIHEALSTVLIPKLEEILAKLISKSQEWENVSLLSLTHGQPATPTTVSEQMMVFADRLNEQVQSLALFKMNGKFGGAVGNYSAHSAAYPDVDWKAMGEQFVRSFDLRPLRHTTQINPHDDLAEMSHQFVRINNILLDFCRDMWMYILRGTFKQKVVAGEIGSSTMPNKVNPIDFENAEGNIGLANALFEHFAAKLPLSRLQRDLSDSTVQRSLGTAFGYSLIAFTNVLKGLSKVDLDCDAVRQELRENPEVVAEAIQTVLRKYKVPGAYEKLMELTKGRKVSIPELEEYIRGLPISAEDQQTLLGRLDIHR